MRQSTEVNDTVRGEFGRAASLLGAASLFALASMSGGQTSTDSEGSTGAGGEIPVPYEETTKEVIPGTGSPYHWDSVQDACDSQHIVIIDDSVHTPITITTTTTYNVEMNSDSEENCTSIVLPMTLNWEYQRTHRWDLSGSFSLSAEATVRSGLLSRVVAKGEVGVGADLTVGGSRSEEETYTFGREVCLNLPPCLAVQVTEFRDDVLSKGSQGFGRLYMCGIDDDPYVYFEETERATAIGKGDRMNRTRWTNSAPCGHNCDDPRDQEVQERELGIEERYGCETDDDEGPIEP